MRDEMWRDMKFDEGNREEISRKGKEYLSLSMRQEGRVGG
jgi:hypothetical protein